ncbi:PREDICTED: rRNA-processing protein EFG1-like isoform X3 [Nicrophorus vespilloides]|uniref:rRNA-processing protein EFG1-like isoform X3 n=1 Tax=Nicrophorus vespilloides TaxID=110193 RepID=A0ABM1M761_NICVS|nr:PREDICTED: rRNA-processing protein EFG1-like isoform X3 [Nicrophorus vespilloides]
MMNQSNQSSKHRRSYSDEVSTIKTCDFRSHCNIKSHKKHGDVDYIHDQQQESYSKCYKMNQFNQSRKHRRSYSDEVSTIKTCDFGTQCNIISHKKHGDVNYIDDQQHKSYNIEQPKYREDREDTKNTEDTEDTKNTEDIKDTECIEQLNVIKKQMSSTAVVLGKLKRNIGIVESLIVMHFEGSVPFDMNIFHPKKVERTIVDESDDEDLDKECSSQTKIARRMLKLEKLRRSAEQAADEINETKKECDSIMQTLLLGKFYKTDDDDLDKESSSQTNSTETDEDFTEELVNSIHDATDDDDLDKASSSQTNSGETNEDVTEEIVKSSTSKKQTKLKRTIHDATDDEDLDKEYSSQLNSTKNDEDDNEKFVKPSTSKKQTKVKRTKYDVNDDEDLDKASSSQTNSNETNGDVTEEIVKSSTSKKQTQLKRTIHDATGDEDLDKGSSSQLNSTKTDDDDNEKLVKPPTNKKQTKVKRTKHD